MNRAARSALAATLVIALLPACGKDAAPADGPQSHSAATTTETNTRSGVPGSAPRAGENPDAPSAPDAAHPKRGAGNPGDADTAHAAPGTAEPHSGKPAEGDAPEPGTGATKPKDTKTGAGTGTDAAKPGSKRAARVTQPPDLSIPDAPPFTADAARDVFAKALADAKADPELAAAALDYLGRLPAGEGIRAAAAKFLVKGDDVGGYTDDALAAAALAALQRFGDGEASAKILAMARACAAEADPTCPEALLPAIARLPEADAVESRALLLKFAGDETIRPQVLAACAAMRSHEAADLAATVAADAEGAMSERGVAVAVLLNAADARAAKAADAVVASATEQATGFEAIVGLAVPGVTESLPVIRKLALAAIKEDNARLDIRSTAEAFVTIRGAGHGDKEDAAFLRSLLGKDDGDADPNVRAALWELGDDAEAPAAAEVLAAAVGGMRHGFNDGPGVDLFDALAVRGGATAAPFARLVNAAGAIVVPADPKRPDVAQHANRIRLAAAYAVLASAKR